MTDTPAPTTEAGRQLIQDAQDAGTVDVGWVRAAIHAIEAEARSTPAEALAHKIADRMAQAYNLSMARAADVAKACDESIDPTGNLLGWLREYARLRSPDALFRLLQEPGDVADLPTATDALDGPYNTAGSHEEPTDD